MGLGESRYLGCSGGSLLWTAARVALVLAVLGPVPSARADIRYILDFDGTINHDQGVNAGWRSFLRLKRIEERHTAMQPNPGEKFRTPEGGEFDLPPTIDISYGEYRRYLSRWGKGEAMIGDLRPVQLDADVVGPQLTLWTVPGLYRLSADVSYYRFRPSTDGTNYLLEDYEAAKRRESLTKGAVTWRGRAFPLFQAALAHPDSLVVLSARSNPEAAFLELFAAMETDRWIPSAVRTVDGVVQQPRFHLLTSADAVLWNARSIAERKARAVEKEAEQLLVGPFLPHDELVPEISGARAGLKRPMHVVLVAEDEPSYVQAVGKKLEQLSHEARYANQIKFVLFQTGTDQDVRDSSWTRRWTVFDRGFAREALPEEIAAWSGKGAKPACARLVAGDVPL